MERRQSDVELALLRQDVNELKSDVRELLEAWSGAKGTLTVVKWSVGIAAGLAAIWATVKGIK